MKLLTGFNLLEAVAAGVGRPVLEVAFDASTPTEEIYLAAPYLADAEGHARFLQIMVDGHGYIVCDSEEECERLFGLTVGDDGPTPTNPYNGTARVYAATSTGNENT